MAIVGDLSRTVNTTGDATVDYLFLTVHTDSSKTLVRVCFKYLILCTLRRSILCPECRSGERQKYRGQKHFLAPRKRDKISRDLNHMSSEHVMV